MKGPEAGDKPKAPYAKYAFQNPYNYALMGGFASAAMLTGNWWLGVAAAGMEALWMLFAPDSRLLRATWFDRQFQAEQAAQRRAALEATLQTVPPADATRCRALQAKREEINSLAHENPAFTVDLISGELKKLEDLVRAFLELTVTCSRYGDYLESIDLDQIERDLRRFEQAAQQSEGDKRTLAQKNLTVLRKRKEKYAEISSYLSSARGQLDLIENSFRLLADQIVTMRSPQELGGQLDELLDGVEAARQTARETDRLLQTIER